MLNWKTDEDKRTMKVKKERHKVSRTKKNGFLSFEKKTDENEMKQRVVKSGQD
jgi:hypothetical protein